MQLIINCIDFLIQERYYSTDFKARSKMRKTVIATLILLFSCSMLPAQNSAANDAYVKAMTTPDPSQKASLLKNFLSQYPGSQYENFASAELCILQYSGKTPRETIDYGEKALSLGGLDDLTKCKVLFMLANMSTNQGQNLSKASSYASQVVQISKANKSKNSELAPAATWNQFIGGGYYVQGQALEKAKDYRGAVDAYINSYDMLKDPRIINDLKKLGKTLYDGKAYNDAEKALKIAAMNSKDFASVYLYAKALHRNGKTEDALSQYKTAYMKQKSGEVAFNIGILLAKKAEKNAQFTDEALQYLLDASFLSEANSKKAMQMAESLYFHSQADLKYNEKVQELKEKSEYLEELTNTFNQKFGEKEEEDLSDSEKKEMEKMLEQIEAEQKAIKKLEAETQAALDEFQKLIDKTKQRLGIQ
jgi:tetratricopeptide (TPR) repeat protein